MKAKTMTYDAVRRRAVITFPNGREFALADVTEEKANEFLEKHADEFGRRDCVLHSVGGTLTREEGSNEF
jgi:hypothetical protein